MRPASAASPSITWECGGVGWCGRDSAHARQQVCSHAPGERGVAQNDLCVEVVACLHPGRVWRHAVWKSRRGQEAHTRIATLHTPNQPQLTANQLHAAPRRLGGCRCGCQTRRRSAGGGSAPCCRSALRTAQRLPSPVSQRPAQDSARMVVGWVVGRLGGWSVGGRRLGGDGWRGGSAASARLKELVVWSSGCGRMRRNR